MVDLTKPESHASTAVSLTSKPELSVNVPFSTEGRLPHAVIILHGDQLKSSLNCTFILKL